MKRLLTNLTGGVPLTMDDLNLIQENVKELTSAISEGISVSGDPYILYGADISVTGSGGPTPHLIITKGAIWKDDEIFLVDDVDTLLADGTTYASVIANYEWDLSSINSNTVLFKNSSSQDIYQTNKAIFTNTPTTWSGVKNLLNLSNTLIPIASDTVAGIVEKATAGEVTAGTADKYIDAYLLKNYLSGFTNDVIVTSIPIGTWNMDSIGAITVSWILPANHYITNIQAMILYDGGSLTQTFPINFVNNLPLSAQISGTVFYDVNVVRLERLTGGFFDQAAFSSTANNRGYIEIHYKHI